MVVFLMIRHPPRSPRTDTLVTYTTLLRSDGRRRRVPPPVRPPGRGQRRRLVVRDPAAAQCVPCLRRVCAVAGAGAADGARLGQSVAPAGDSIRRRDWIDPPAHPYYPNRSAERRVGEACVRSVSSWWSPDPKKKKK